MPQPVQTAIDEALDDEFRAEAFYAAVIAAHGDIRPFVNIIEAEKRHAAMLDAVLTTYGLAAPANPYLDGTKPALEAPATIAEACKAGVAAEIANRDLYDDNLIPAAAGYPDVIAVFEALRDASQNNHLPAFQRCVARYS
ncbi:MAG: DUF2202 domain-containing protein [Bauldia sp.]|nr:DUF2202 domain-containing protein [Bauldia sp.]